MQSQNKRFLGTALFFCGLLLVGTLGYMGIEGSNWQDALYMTVITLTAVGYDEVFPLSQTGRMFTSFILFGGITGLGLWFAILTSFIVELDLQDVFRRRRTLKEIKKMKNHIIVCGAGRTGGQVVEELLMAGESFVVVERDLVKVQELQALLPGLKVVVGDATIDHFLEEAMIAEAKGLITCLSADTDNLFVCLTARDLRPDLEIVATRSPDLTLRMEQEVVAPTSPLAGKTLMDARIPHNTGLIVIAIRKKNPEGSEEDFTYVFNPQADTRLGPGDVMIVLGKTEQIEGLKKFVNP